MPRIKKEGGFTLVEMMIVVTILGFLAAVSVSLVSVLLNANLSTTQLMEQQNKIESSYGFLSSRFALAQYADIGTDKSGEIDALSVAGDQLLFASSSGASKTCYRLMYLGERREIRVATSSGSCGGSLIAPKRGPNEEVGGGYYRLPGQSLFDPALDSAYPEVRAFCQDNPTNSDCTKAYPNGPSGAALSYALADGIRNYDFSDADLDRLPSSLRAEASGGYLAPFLMLSRSGEALGSPAPSALAERSNQGSGFYNRSTNTARALLGGLDMRTFVLATEPDGTVSQIVSGRFYSQKFFFNQLCDLDGQQTTPTGSGSVPLDSVGPGEIQSLPAAGPVRRTSKFSLDPTDFSWQIIDFDADPNGSLEEDGQSIRVPAPGRYLVAGGVTRYIPDDFQEGEISGTPLGLYVLRVVRIRGGNTKVVAASSSGLLSGMPTQISAIADLEEGDRLQLQAAPGWLDLAGNSEPPPIDLFASSGAPIELQMSWINQPQEDS